MIDGVEIKYLETHTDHRGFFREVIRYDDLFMSEQIKQISHSKVYSGVIKAWHAHKYQTQWNYVVRGLIYVILFDLRDNSPTYGKKMEFICGDDQKNIVYKFPNGVLHGYKCLNGPMDIIYFTSGKYDIEDEIRIKHDDPIIGVDWKNLFEII
jgi:dTDP-4-dehydrorhamnose 3,5-epimerase